MAVGEFALIQEWDQYLAACDRSPATRRHYSYWLYRFLSEIRPASLDDVREADVTRFLAALGRSPAKSKAALALRSFFCWAEARGRVAADPAKLIRPKAPMKTPVRALRREEEIIRLMVAAAWRDPRRAWTLLLCYGLGTRRSELAGIRPEDVADGTVLVRGKGGKRRQIPLGPLAREALEELRPWWNGTVVGGIHPQTVTAWAQQAARDADLIAKTKGRSAHILRASFATRLLHEGIPVSVVSELLGHSDVAITTRYLAVDAQDRQAAVQVL